MIRFFYPACVFAILTSSVWGQESKPAPVAPDSGEQATVQSETPDKSAPEPNSSIDAGDPLLKPPPLPKGNPTLLGGIVGKVDTIHDAVVVAPFGGGKIKVFFDDRTRIFRDGVETTMLGIRRGDRVYVDTLQDNGRVFAKNIRVETHSPAAEAHGQVVRYNPQSERLEIRDSLSSQPVSFRVAKTTVVRGANGSGSLNDLLPGALVEVRFSADSPGRDLVREIDVLASPGSSFVFQGKVTYLNMSRGMFALHNQKDAKDYEIHFDPAARIYDELGVGQDITVTAMFDGKQYVAHAIGPSQGQ